MAIKKLPLSPLDMGVAIAFAVIGVLGGVGWYFLSDDLTTAIGEAGAAKSEFDKLSVSQGIVVSAPNKKTLEDNIAMLVAHVNPLITDKLLAKDNTLSSIGQVDPIAWKHDLNKELAALNNAAKQHGVKVPANFYYGFSSYISKNPTEEQTQALNKQLRAIKVLTTILVNAQVKSITTIRRSYEEEGKNAANAAGSGDTDRLAGSATDGPGNAYKAWPFEVEFEGSTDSLRKVVDDLVQSPYVFITRTVEIHNQVTTSPHISGLEAIASAGAPPPSVTGSSPGEVAAAPVLGPQFLFSNNTLRLKLRIDLIEWKIAAVDATPPPSAKPAPKSGAKK